MLAVPASGTGSGADNLHVNLDFDPGSSALYTDSSPPNFLGLTRAHGEVQIQDIDLASRTADIVNLEVFFSIPLCLNEKCTRTTIKSYCIEFNNGKATVTLNNPSNNRTIDVNATLSGGRVYQDDDGRPLHLTFARFQYNVPATGGLFYEVDFSFYSPEFRTNITVNLTGPKP